MTDRKQIVSEIDTLIAEAFNAGADNYRTGTSQPPKGGDFYDRIVPLMQGGGWTTWIERFADEVAKRLPPLREFPEKEVDRAICKWWNDGCKSNILDVLKRIWEGHEPREGENTYELGSQPCPECGFPVNTWDKCCPACNPGGDNILEFL